MSTPPCQDLTAAFQLQHSLMDHQFEHAFSPTCLSARNLVHSFELAVFEPQAFELHRQSREAGRCSCAAPAPTRCFTPLWQSDPTPSANST
mmetsp:Transcript_6949/g.18669  ORF Transcript_6949/g.18669 Transcript_6949/m.18669 type:complete len:91 (-) Transcript_6949:580-852(-)